MLEKKIKVALIYKKDYIFFDEQHFDKTTYYFFMNALQRNEKLEISYFSCGNEFDIQILGSFRKAIVLKDMAYDKKNERLKS